MSTRHERRVDHVRTPPVRFRLVLVGLVLCGALYVASVPRGATAATTPTSPATHPLYQFVDTGTQPLPW
ncbi:MAG TPA: hypothetical protein VFN59_08415, partial [Acidimicrobiales bacterium]|nr:hypothetical protein [Acidimicrobiales bacterium]